MIDQGNLYAGLLALNCSEECCQDLFSAPGLRIERIVSFGQTTPPGKWYDQPQGEWVVLLAGAAELRIAEEAVARVLGPGDWVYLPPHCRHRVEGTQAAPPTVWLAVHCGGAEI